MNVISRLSVVTLAAFALSGSTIAKQAPADSTEIVKQLRLRMLTISPESFPSTSDAPIAVIIDVRHFDAVVTVFAASTGDASVYSSNGGALIGGRASQQVRSAAIEAVREAGRHLNQLQAVSSYPYPTLGNVTIYVRTRKGVFAAERPLASLIDKSDPLTPLYEVTEKVRKAMESIVKVQPGQILSLEPPR